MERPLAWDGCTNVRDLGGLGRIRHGALVRADALQQLSAEGWRALERHGIRTVVDLRNPDEIGEDTAPRPPGLTTIRIPLDGMEDTESGRSGWTAPSSARPTTTARGSSASPTAPPARSPRSPAHSRAASPTTAASGATARA
jgi:hypothetical protein